jgi:periplasmic copper chaperone A
MIVHRGVGTMQARGLRLLVGSVLVALVVALGATAAGAHVEVVPSSAPKGGFEILSFSVPNEETAANTVTVQVNLPTRYPIASVSIQPKPGWSTVVKKSKLAKPVQSDDGEVTEAVTQITWTATDGGLKPGEFDLFTISAGPLPTNTNQLVFKAIQTYSDGTTVSWIQQTVKGTPEPDHPAPVLKLTAAASGHH